MSWRSVSAKIIRKILADNAGRPETQIKRALFNAYPFGERSYHPYKIWCSEIRIQRGLRPPLNFRTAKVKEEISDKNQKRLF